LLLARLSKQLDSSPAARALNSCTALAGAINTCVSRLWFLRLPRITKFSDPQTSTQSTTGQKVGI
jgi:hypothetical protein